MFKLIKKLDEELDGEIVVSVKGFLQCLEKVKEAFESSEEASENGIKEMHKIPYLSINICIAVHPVMRQFVSCFYRGYWCARLADCWDSWYVMDQLVYS